MDTHENIFLLMLFLTNIYVSLHYKYTYYEYIDPILYTLIYKW